LENKINRIRELTKLLNQYRNKYYNLNQSSISDNTYDSLFDELTILEAEENYVLSDSPTKTVGYTVKSKLQKVEHSIPLLSLNKTKDISEATNFIGKQDSLLMLKADGLTCELIYESGHLKQASTRGNSIIGEDITHNALVFKGLPININWQGRLKIVGEAIIHWDDFNKINLNIPEEEKYKTPRNLSAGSVRQLNSQMCANRDVYFYAFGLLESDTEFTTKVQQFQWLNKYGFNVIPYSILTYDTMILNQSIDDMRQLAEIKYIPIDGMVISYNDLKYANSLNVTAHHPLHSIAFKFKQEAEETTLINVMWQVSRTGVITPVAEFETVELDGTEVSKASIHNLSIMKKLELGVDDKITVIKANQIIPQIEDNLTRSNNINIPKVCPSCGEKTEIRNTGTANFLYCTNDNCPAQLLDKFTHFVSRDAMNIDGLSAASLEKFINKGFIKTFSDIYKLEQYKSQITQMDGFGIKSYNKLIEAIEKSKNVNMSNFIYSLGIPQIGVGGAKRLAKHFNNDINKFLDATQSLWNFLNIQDFGEITAQEIYNYFQDENNIKQIDELLDFYITIIRTEEKKPNNQIIDNPLKGKKVYGTGTFANYKKEELKSLIESLGCEFASGYAKSLDYLIVGSLKGSGKEDKAKADGIKILSEDEFIKIIGKENN
jgi:DNA ligase (NAD+)